MQYNKINDGFNDDTINYYRRLTIQRQIKTPTARLEVNSIKNIFVYLTNKNNKAG